MSSNKYITYSGINTLNKNYTNIFIPSGPKYLATFKNINNKPLCILYDIDNKIHKNVYVSFDPILTIGTILYGTLINNTFICENILEYNNKRVSDNFIKKYELLGHILNQYIKTTKINGLYNFKLPFMTNNEPIFNISEMNYPIYGIVQLYPRPSLYKLSNLFGNFIIYKDAERPDVYKLYVINDTSEYYVCNAYVNDIKTSYLLRKLFKNKKNYKNIEYSDDEDTPEIPSDEKYYITCLSIPRYKKWKPY